MNYFISLNIRLDGIYIIAGAVIVAVILNFIFSMFRPDIIDDIEYKLELDNKTEQPTSPSGEAHSINAIKNSQGRLILSGHIIKSIYYTLLISLVLISPFYYFMANYPHFFVEHIEETVDGVKIFTPVNTGLLRSYIFSIDLSRNITVVFVSFGILASINDLSKILIHSQKTIDQDASNFVKLVKKVRLRQLFIRLALVIIVGLSLVYALNLSNDPKNETTSSFGTNTDVKTESTNSLNSNTSSNSNNQVKNSTLLLVDYECGDFCGIQLKDINSGVMYGFDEMDEKTQTNGITDRIQKKYYSDGETDRYLIGKQFYATIEYRETDIWQTTSTDEPPVKTGKKETKWMINSLKESPVN